MGQRAIWVLTIDEALEFLDCLPDRHTDDIKAYIRTQFLLVTGGDPTLHDEIDRNAASTGAIQQIAREAVGVSEAGTADAAQLNVDDPEVRELKKRRLLAEVVHMEQENLINIKTYLEEEATSEHLDSPTRQLLKDLWLNTLVHEE